MALRVGLKGPFLKLKLSRYCHSLPGGRRSLARRERMGRNDFGLSLGNEQLSQNWYGQGESDCLIKTKHCDGRNRC